MRRFIIVLPTVCCRLSLREQRIELLLNFVLRDSILIDSEGVLHIRVFHVLAPVCVIGPTRHDALLVTHVVLTGSEDQASRIVGIRRRLELM